MNQPVLFGKKDKPEIPSGSSRSPRVLHLINGEHFSGAERVQDLLGLSLGQFGFEVSFACLKPGLFPAERQSTSQLFELDMKSKVDFKAIQRLGTLIQDEHIDVLHAHTPRTLLAGSLVKSRSGCPLVYHVHSPVGRDSTRSVANRINQLVESWSARQVDHFICVSDSIRDYMIEIGHPPDKLTTVPNGVAVIQDLPSRERPGKSWTLGTTALFRPRKGTELLLESLAMLRAQGYEVRLLAVGPFETSEYESRIKSLATQMGVDDLIEWTGFVNDVDAEFCRMDAFVLPSLFGEGLPMVILEAMAIGTPVISAEVEGVNQAIRAGRDGLIFEPGNVNGLANCVIELIEHKHDWQSIRASALHRQRHMFSDTSMAGGVATIYEQVLRSRQNLVRSS